MSEFNFNIIENLAFKTLTYHKNYDLLYDGHKFFISCEGTISKLRIIERKPPLIIGEYDFDIVDLATMKLLNYDISSIDGDNFGDILITEFFNMIKSNEFEIENYDKAILLNNLILTKEFRGKFVSDEFIEMMFRNYYDERTIILGLFLPIQYNKNNSNSFLNERVVRNKLKAGVEEYHTIPAVDYYSLRELNTRDDEEYDTYKIYSVADRLGFRRLNLETSMFVFEPEKTRKRMFRKHLYEKSEKKH